MFDDPGICFCWREFKETTFSASCDDEPDNSFVKKKKKKRKKDQIYLVWLERNADTLICHGAQRGGVE